jgi:hypothetical protein
MNAIEREYADAKAVFLAAQARLERAKAALPRSGPSKSDLLREAAFLRDDRVMTRYNEGITSVTALAAEFCLSASCIRTIISGAGTSCTQEYRERTLARIQEARRRKSSRLVAVHVLSS